MNDETRTCQNCKQSFVIEPEDFAFYEKMKVPTPTFCPECRLIRRLSYRNEHFLFRRKDAHTGQDIFSGIPPEAPYKVYDRDYWWSDAFDAAEYARDYDFSKPFFEQYHALMSDAPWPSRTVIGMVNSDYCEQASYLKNVYLGFDTDKCENCAYLVNAGNLKECFDMLGSFNDELSYESTMLHKSYRTFFSYNCEDCHNVWCSRDCSGCTDCFGCVNLKNKTYHIYNQPYTKEEYEKKIAEMNLGSFSSFRQHFEKANEFWKGFPVRYLNGWRNASSSGDYLSDTKNVKFSFLASQVQNSKFIQLLFYGCADSYDFTVWAEDATQIYECATCGMQIDSLKFCYDCWPACRNLEYCMSCRNSSNCFGCFGLRNKEYCIFNKQYSKEEYAVLREKIIAQMNAMPYVDSFKNTYRYGEFFPPEFSHLSYNQSFAQDLFPLERDVAKQKGFRWQDADPKEFTVSMKAGEIPDSIRDVPDSILQQVIECEECKKAYRIIAPELAFLKAMNIPLSRRCVECRLARRFALLNRPRYRETQCSCKGAEAPGGSAYANTSSHFHGAAHCTESFVTTYDSAKNSIIYCERCYQAETA